jgi:hypothetical protein
MTAAAVHGIPRASTMLSNFFVLSPRGDTIISKQYRNERGDVGAHERSHTEAFFRKIKFWDDMSLTPGSGTLMDVTVSEPTQEEDGIERKGDAPPVFMMPDGLSYFHVKRNGLIFGCSTARNVSPTTVIDVRVFIIVLFLCEIIVFKVSLEYYSFSYSTLACLLTFFNAPLPTSVTFHHCKSLQGLLWNTLGGGYTKEFHSIVRVARRNARLWIPTSDTN